MTPQEYESLRQLFFEVADLAPEARRKVLDEKCGNDTELRSSIDELLTDSGNSADMLCDALVARGVSADSLHFLDPAEPVPDGKQVGKYTIVKRIGQGGMGTVYEARQATPKRTVALKIIQSGFASDSTGNRFRREADALARLQHPGIAQIYEAQVADFGNGPQAYLAMEFVRGSALVTYANSHQLSLRDRLELFAHIAEAVHHAHQKGVIHRDLKPDNILIDGEGHPKVVDFGVARLLETDAQPSTFDTDMGQVVGTLAYMSPEQATGRIHDVDVRTDVYSLGVVLSELLVNQLPHDVKGLMLHEAVKKIAEDEPQRVGSIDSTLRGDVDAIVCKSMARDQQERYQSASDLVRDIKHYLNGEPIDAKRASTWYVIRKSIQRYRIAAGVALAFALLLGASTIALSIMYQNQSRAREAADLARTSEENQRKLAEQRESEAVAARAAEEEQRKLAERRANELQTITEFQQAMIGDIDAQQMGREIIEELRAGISNRLQQGDMFPQEFQASMASFDQLIGKVNVTNVALNVFDKTVLSRAVEAIDSDFADEPLLRAALQHAVADKYKRIGLLEPAMPLEEASLRTLRLVKGDDHPDTLESISRMGNLLMNIGRYTEAEPYLREALQGRRRILGEDHEKTLESVSGLGGLYVGMGRFEEGERYQLEALEGSRRVLGDDHRVTLAAISRMGGMFLRMGKYAEAEPYVSEALQRQRRVMGNDHQATLIAISHMGSLRQAMGSPDDAERYHLEALEGSRRVLGDDHPVTLTFVNNLACLFDLRENHHEAEVYFLEALKGGRRILGNDHPKTLLVLNNLGTVLQSLDRYDEAEPYLREASEGSRRTLGADHPVTLTFMANLGKLLNKLGRHDETATLLEAGEAAAREVWTANNPGKLGTHLARLGEARAGQGKYPAAEKTQLEAYALCLAGFGADHEKTLKSINALIDLYNGWHAAEPDKGYGAKASEWRAKLPEPKDDEETASP